jgi:tetratricopeptide (TPR) repeat protein
LIFGSRWPETKAADDLREQGRYEEAFDLYAKIASDASNDAHLRAYVYASMGWLIVPCPNLGEGRDESGYAYFARALELVSDCGDAWSGLVTTYGDHMPYHQDQGRFLEGLGRLLQVQDELPEVHKRMLQQGMEQLGVPIKTFKPEDEYWKG